MLLHENLTQEMPLVLAGLKREHGASSLFACRRHGQKHTRRRKVSSVRASMRLVAPLEQSMK